MLMILAYITLVFFGIRFLVALSNVLFSPVLKTQKQDGEPLVSVLIPARNEEHNIGNILNDLQKQSYQHIEVIVFNDQSTDRTTEIVGAFAKTDERFQLINSKGLSEGWLGKSNACFQLATKATGEYFLFLDADVRVESGLFESALAQMQNHGLKLLSIFPKQEMITIAEKITVPVMNSILLSLLPMVLTRESSRPSLAAANGQFMLFEKETYQKLQPHEKVKTLLVEDILIARLYKKSEQKMQCMTGNETIRCRMYQNLNESLNGFARSVAEFFGGSHLAAFLYWLFGTFGVFAMLFGLPTVFTFVTLALMTGIILFISVSSRQPFWQNLLLAIPRQLLLGVIVFLSFRNKKLKKTKWKGRNIS
ncbi:glycosyltransferase [Mariniphaga sp.]|uniref:glycosyltransferase n=1 Tax=Mariniphaga sp. TaxID=1954475 RepID=UPI003569BBAD